MKFLEKHGSEFRFIAGVGQVPLEAASFGLPAAVIPHKNDTKLATVLTEESFYFLRKWNFVIRQCPDDTCLGNFEEFMLACDNGNIDRFNVQHLVAKHCTVDEAMRVYLKQVFPTYLE